MSGGALVGLHREQCGTCIIRPSAPNLLLRVIARVWALAHYAGRNKNDREAIVSDTARLSKPRTLSGADAEQPEPWVITPVSARRPARTRPALAPTARTMGPVQAAPSALDDIADLYGDFA